MSCARQASTWPRGARRAHRSRRRWLSRALIDSLISVPLATVLALSIAVLLTQNIAFQGVFRTLFYMPPLVTDVAVAIAWIMMLHPDYGISALVYDEGGLRR